MSFDHPPKPPEPSEKLLSAAPLFWCTLWAAYLPLVVLSGFALGCLGLGDHGVLAVLPCMMLSRYVAVVACRRAGVSREEQRREEIQRDPRAILAPLLSEAPAFELKHTPGRPMIVSRQGIAQGERSARWSDVGSCLWTTRHDVLGKQVVGNLLLLGHDKTPLFQDSLSQAQADQLLPAIRFYLRGEGIAHEPAST